MDKFSELQVTAVGGTGDCCGQEMTEAWAASPPEYSRSASKTPLQAEKQTVCLQLTPEK